ncbi:MAG: phosphatidylserine decarboxylase [Cognaticolwellia sp.]|jgi:phosphatidylserine decarboxylase
MIFLPLPELKIEETIMMENIKYIKRKTGELITETPPGEAFLKFLYYNPFGELALDLLVKRKMLSALYGRMMNQRNSTQKITNFVSSLNIDMNESVKAVEDFTSFNDFFYRKLKPEARPIEQGLVSPADAKLIAFENLEEVNTFFVKGQKFTLEAFLQDKDLAAKYRNSAMLIFRLAPNDYHRFHFPYNGHASKAHEIKGRYYSVSPYALHKDFTKVFCENKREYVLLSTPDKGEILLSPVGATMVGTIIETYTSNSDIKKGDEMGYFAFGGSTVVMLIDKNQFKIDSDILENTKKGIETAVVMGERIGI